MKVTFIAPEKITKRVAGAEASVLAIMVGEGKLSGPAGELDKFAKGEIVRAIANSKFTGKAKQTLLVLLPKGMAYSHLLLLGGAKADVTPQKVEAAFAETVDKLNAAGVKSITVLAEDAEQGAYAASGLVLRSYKFDKYFTKQKPEKKPTLKEIRVMTPDAVAAKKVFGHLGAVAEGVYFARDFGNEPPNVLYPEEFANRVRDTLVPLGVKVEILDVKAMEKLGMGSLLGVGLGSTRPSRLVVLQWHGAPNSKDIPIAICGKGVTFDTGGISIKPAGGMEEMKYDMSGAGVVAGLFYALARRKANVNAIGVMGMVENMPDGNAIRPGDILTSMSGQTIEVLNTDAEGRLVLADVLWYAQERFKPTNMVNLATLTGACVVALGYEYAGIMGNDKGLIADVRDAGETVGELCWELPLNEVFDERINSRFADMQNISSVDRAAGSSIGGQFLNRFVKKETKWVHMDIAGVAHPKKAIGPLTDGASGFGIRLLDRMIAEKFEK